MADLLSGASEDTGVVGQGSAPLPRVSPAGHGTATFYLGSHHATSRWWALGVPLFVSVRVLRKRRTIAATAPWALDSGAFSEISAHGRFQTSESEYVESVQRLAGLSDLLTWVAPRDWMCEPFILNRTGLTVREHQRRTVASFLSLRDQLGPLVVPVLQGYTPTEYLDCYRLYKAEGVELERESVVGLGSVCKRSGTREAKQLVTYLALGFGLRLHGFGIKGDTFKACRSLLASADSMAWSAAARREGRDSNSPAEAMRWRASLLDISRGSDTDQLAERLSSRRR